MLYARVDLERAGRLQRDAFARVLDAMNMRIRSHHGAKHGSRDVRRGAEGTAAAAAPAAALWRRRLVRRRT